MEYKYFKKTFLITTLDGKKKQLKVYGKTKKEVNEKYLKLRLEHEQGKLTLNGTTPLGQWVNQWATTYKINNMTTKSYKDMNGIIKNTYGKLFDMPLKDIKSTHLQNCLNQRAGQSASRIHKAAIYIKAIFNSAVDNDLIVKNPSRTITEPKGTKSTRRSLTEEEVNLFMKVLPKHKHGLLFGISLACGLRPAEARALLWSDISEGMATISKAVESGSNAIKSPKTNTSNRQVPIPDWYLRLLSPIKKIGLVFPNTKGTPINEQNYNRAWKSFLRLMDIEAGAKLYRNKIIAHVIDQNITPYYLRHTYATNLVKTGIDIKTAQRLLGHADISTTGNIYAHTTNEMIKNAKKLINIKPY